MQINQVELPVLVCRKPKLESTVLYGINKVNTQLKQPNFRPKFRLKLANPKLFHLRSRWLKYMTIQNRNYVELHLHMVYS